MKVLRNIIEIDEDLCNGCGQCILDCAEGAIRLVDGKAKVISDNLCDGLGACIGGCPTGALKIIQREAAPFDMEEVMKRGHHPAPAPSSQAAPAAPTQNHAAPAGIGLGPMPGRCPGSSPMGNIDKNVWPIKLRLVSSLPQGADVLLTADCAAPVVNGFKEEYAKGRRVITMCPKFEDTATLTAKLADLFRAGRPRGVTFIRVSVPCCRGVAQVCADALAMSGLDVPAREAVVTPDGEISVK